MLLSAAYTSAVTAALVCVFPGSSWSPHCFRHARGLRSDYLKGDAGKDGNTGIENVVKKSVRRMRENRLKVNSALRGVSSKAEITKESFDDYFSGGAHCYSRQDLVPWC